MGKFSAVILILAVFCKISGISSSVAYPPDASSATP